MYFLKRILFAIPLMLVISLIVFTLADVMPGSPFDRERAPASPEIERNMRARIHYDDPFWEKYLRYFGLVWERGVDGQWHHAPATWNLSSRYRNHTVSDVIAEGLPVSMTLGGLAFCVSMLVGLPLGFLTAARRGQWPDAVGSFFSVLLVCIPGFVMAPLLILVFSIKWHVFPVALWETHAI